MKPKVSVIVPVYNTEKYLEKCIESLVNQTLENIEIIIINDGSTDNSQRIIDRLQEKYPSKIITLYTENKGPGNARNYGIKMARARYVGFADSDDFVDQEMFKKLYKLAKQGHDFIMCDYVEIKNTRKKVYKGFRGKQLDQKQAVMHITKAAFSWNKLIKKSLFKSTLYPDGWYEDLATIPLLLTNAKSPAYLNKPLYYYNIRSGSITKSNDLKTLGVIQAWKRLLTEGNPRYQQELEYAVAKNIYSFLKFKPEFTEQFMDFAKKHKDILLKNTYYKEAIKRGKLRNLFTSD
ncbi:glycosyltransferase [Anaerobacillus alkaliphilus]|uniref:Glycosyltransferase n=1 Tax=Anaerobacillus alkaliphilus TaxID=1548597 RepID=A0A4Q0VP38_9BACI|nr:glycosyltransferase [Anaerobacillus alkaliphilus]RXI98196.1 glycosyltransferase [Anaerobacillus alkaliphilus]